jgi:hypothetical protein
VDRPSRGLVLAFLLSLAFVGWLGVVGIGEVTDAHHGLFAPDPNACGGP